MRYLSFVPHGGVVESLTFEDLVRATAESGCNGIELAVLPKWFDVHDKSAVAHVCKVVRDHGLAAPVLSCHAISPTAPERSDEWVPYMQHCIDAAHELGAEVIMLWPNLAKGQSLDVALDTLKRNLSQILDAATDAGLRVSLEFEKAHALDNYRFGLGFIRGFDSRLALTADTFHIFNDGAPPYEAVLEMQGFIGDVHLSDSHRLRPGLGLFDFETFLRALRQIGYEGNLTFQYQVTDLASIADAVRYVKELLERIG